MIKWPVCATIAAPHDFDYLDNHRGIRLRASVHNARRAAGNDIGTMALPAKRELALYEGHFTSSSAEEYSNEIGADGMTALFTIRSWHV